MAEEADPFPDWDRPATKGDVISAMIATRACVVDAYVAMSRLRRNDMAGFAQAVASLDQSDEKLQKTIQQLGGRVSADGE